MSLTMIFSFWVQDQAHSSQSNTGLDICRFGSHDHAKQLASELPFKSFPASDGESRFFIFACYMLY
jgi:hypothetical protein